MVTDHPSQRTVIKNIDCRGYFVCLCLLSLSFAFSRIKYTSEWHQYKTRTDKYSKWLSLLF